jgi:hypothetical protein
MTNLSDDFREADDGMFINTNVDEYERYKLARAKAKRDSQIIEKMDYLQREISNIKLALQEINSRIT